MFEPGQGSKLLGLSDKVLSGGPIGSNHLPDRYTESVFYALDGRSVTSPSYMFDSEPIASHVVDAAEKFDFVIFDGSPLRDYSESSFGRENGRVILWWKRNAQNRRRQKFAKISNQPGEHTGSSFEQKGTTSGIPRTLPLVRRIQLQLYTNTKGTKEGFQGSTLLHHSLFVSFAAFVVSP